MVFAIVYVLAIIGELLFAIGSTFYIFALIYSSLMGSPYVPTKTRVLKEILDKSGLKKGQTFIDLGCGDGRIVRFAADNYGAKAIGVDINPTLIWLSKLTAHWKHSRHLTFKVQNIYHADISQADVIYLFLLPKFLQNLKPKLMKETKKSAVIISHGFKIDGWDEYKVHTIPSKPFPTHFYRLHS